jgi:hypothetical protein
MKIQVTTLFIASSQVGAFVPVSSMRDSTALNSLQDSSWITQPWSSVKQEDFASSVDGGGVNPYERDELEADSWQYMPWSGISENTFYPAKHAGNRLNSVSAAPPSPSQLPAVSPGTSDSTALPEAAVSEAMPELEVSAEAAVMV